MSSNFISSNLHSFTQFKSLKVLSLANNCVSVCVCVYACVYVCVYVYVYVCMRVCMRVCVYVCVYAVIMMIDNIHFVYI